MIRGLYTSSVGMTTQMNRMDVISNNLANVDTTGFKQDITVSRSFPEELTKRLHDPRVLDIFHENTIGRMSLGVQVDMVHTNYSSGSMRSTADPYNVALSGEGFFAINTVDDQGNAVERYTRDGSFLRASDGRLLTKEGHSVAGVNGPVIIPDGEAVIDEYGGIYVDGNFVNSLRITDFEDPQTLRKFGDNLYSRTDESVEIAATGRVLQGYLENSNVNIVREMVDMITVSRAYEANQKMVQTHDSTLARAVSDIARK